MLIRLSHEVGALIISNKPISCPRCQQCPRCLELDGRILHRSEYPEWFETLRVRLDTFRLSDMRGAMPGARYWTVVRPPLYAACAACVRRSE